jgi:hypothetical protein
VTQLVSRQLEKDENKKSLRKKKFIATDVSETKTQYVIHPPTRMTKPKMENISVSF